MMWIVIIFVIVIALIVWRVIAMYNELVSQMEKINVSWSQIDVVLKQRSDLIPNLVAIVQGSGNYEKETLEALIQARNQYLDAASKNEQIAASSQMDRTLRHLFSLNEAYPDLKTNEAYQSLMDKLNSLEDKIAKYRQFYNDMVFAYNRAIQTFPKNVIARHLGYEPASYIEISEEEKASPEVKF